MNARAGRARLAPLWDERFEADDKGPEAAASRQPHLRPNCIDHDLLGIVSASDMGVRAIVLREIRAVAAEQDKVLAPLTDDLALEDSGLDSLCFAILVSRLEDITGRDPLTSAEAASFSRTVGELVALYSSAPG